MNISCGRWLGWVGGLLLAVVFRGAAAAAPERVMTVTGPVAADQLGMVLSHEHVMSTFGAEPAELPAYDEPAVLAAVGPALEALRAAGVGTLVDGTAAYFGRDGRLLRRLAEKHGLHLVTNTGYYGAANGRYLPPGLESLTSDDIAARWVAEWRDGIAGSGIRPGYIKLGVNAGPLRAVDRLLVVAAARAHRATGLTIAVHTGANEAAAIEQLALLAGEGLDPSAWIWIHAQQAASADALVAAARRGAWISLDGWNPALAGRDIATLVRLKEAGLLGRVLLSHDGNLHPAAGGRPRPMDWLSRHGRRAFQAAGLTDEEWRRMTVENPAKAFAVGARLRGPDQPKPE